MQRPRSGKSILKFVGFGLVASLCLLVVFLYVSFLKSYHLLDREHVQNNAHRAYRIFQERFAVTETKVSDWGAWDEAYAYILGADHGFADANLTENVVSGLKINLVAYLTPDLNPVSVKELVDGKLVDKSHETFDFLQKDHPLIAQSHTKSMTGVVSLHGRPALAAAKVVSKGDGSGPPMGRVIFVRELDRDLLRIFYEQTLFKMWTLAPDENGRSDMGEAEERIAIEEGIIYLFPEIAMADFPLEDLNGKLVGTLRAELPRDILVFGETSSAQILKVMGILLLTLIGASVVIYRLFGINTHVDKVLEANKVLAERESYLTALIESVPGYVSWFDRSLHYLGVNKKLASDFDLKPKDFVGKSIGFLHGHAMSGLRSDLEKFFNSDATSKQVTVYQDADGEKKRYLMCFEKYRDDQAVVVVGLDTTAHLRSEEQSANDRLMATHAAHLSALGQMAAGIAHEINSPLAGIQAACLKLRKMFVTLGLEGKCDGIVEKMEETVFRIAKTVTGLRNFARDGVHDPFESCDLKDLVQEVVALCRDKIYRSGIELRVPENLQSVSVMCRKVQIGQVLVNLLNNSFDAVIDLEEKWIEVGISVGNKVEIHITDSGKGIPNDIASRMMEPFFTTKPVDKGTGLGLSISSRIIEDHRGKLFYDTASKNTKFVVAIPFAQDLSESGDADDSIQKGAA
jgi:signal transduction histidine kinase/sensor domain CHASE-containing protein